MATYIISDLHLAENKPVLIKAFECFYHKLFLNDRLIIAGDLFDFFVGLDPEDRVQQQVRDIVKKAAARGITTYFQGGNRDFLVDGRAADFFGMKLLPEYYVVQTKEGPALLLHGDELCLNDRNFQRFRAMSQNRIVKFLFLHLPLSWRKKIGASIRNKSQAQDDQRHLAPEKYGIAHDAAQICLERVNAKIMIHGHFHAFGAHQNEFGERTYRFALGCWDNNFSYFVCDRNKLELVQKPMEKLF